MKILLVLADSQRREALQKTLTDLIDWEIDAYPDFISATHRVSHSEPIVFALLENCAETQEAFELKAALDAAHPHATVLRIAEEHEEDAPSPWPDADRIDLPAHPAKIAAVLGIGISQAGAEDSLPSAGTQMGNYHLLRLENRHPNGGSFLAIQLSLNRPVSLDLFGPEDGLDPEDWNAFLRESAAQSQVVHPAIPAVYEAGEWQGWLFRASERVEGHSLQTLLQNRQKLPLETLLQTGLAVSSALGYLREKKIHHAPLTAAQVLIPGEGSPRLLNTATDHAEGPREVLDDLSLLGQCLQTLAPENLPETLTALLKRTQKGARDPFSRWEEVVKALRGVEMELSGFGDPSADAPRAGRQSRAERHASNPIWGRVALASCLVFAGFIAGWTQWRSPWQEDETPILSAQIALSAGTYLVAGGRPVHLTEYSIDQTEVSNRQYSVFLRSLEKNPAQSRVYDHPEQPAGWSHVPPGWKGCRPVATAAGSGLDWESLPVSGVAWWDAFAFARWSGRGLPSAEEWEAAARGARGFLYPWGDESKNGGARTQETLGPAAPPGPTAVRSQKDRSPSGTLGMAGNVAEWTDSAPGREVRTVKGGSFLTPLESLDSTSAYPCESRLPQLGFRTRSRKD